ncbi:MAG: HEAT repeat domain-containing protein [Anaerocolumna sp.]
MNEERVVEKIRKLTEKRKTEKVEQFLHNKDIEVVKAAIAGLGIIQDEMAFNLLSKLIDHENPEIKKAAIVAFANTGTAQAKTFLQFLLSKETDISVKEVASKALQGFKVK